MKEEYYEYSDKIVDIVMEDLKIKYPNHKEIVVTHEHRVMRVDNPPYYK
jgi:hypothetical protein